jgi:putative addiction module component (TIGR02574 family)
MAQPLPKGMIDQLTVHERLELIGRLWDSLLDQETPTPPSWHRAEVARRVAEADAHPEASIPLEQLKRELRPDQA